MHITIKSADNGFVVEWFETQTAIFHFWVCNTKEELIKAVKDILERKSYD